MAPLKIVAVLAAWLALTAVVAPRVARVVVPDPPLRSTAPVTPLEHDVTALASTVRLEATAERERAAAGVCDYGPRAAPCWCWVHVGDTGVLILSGDDYADCDSAEDYVRSVTTFGPPRRGLKVGFRRRAYDY